MAIARWLNTRRALFDELSFARKILVTVLTIVLVLAFASTLRGIGFDPNSALHSALAGLLGGVVIALSGHLLTGLVAKKPHSKTDL